MQARVDNKTQAAGVDKAMGALEHEDRSQADSNLSRLIANIVLEAHVSSFVHPSTGMGR